MFPQRRSRPPAVIALTDGLPPFARPFSLDALAGKDALLGERPFPSLRACARDVRPLGAGCGAGCAGILLAPPETEARAEEFFAVPAVVYLAGEVTSTFALAWQLLEMGELPPWGSVLAACQTEGRGQCRRLWHSPAGNLHVTFRLPEDAKWKNGAASVLTGYLLASACRRLGLPVSLKWPNDLLIRERDKAGGILLEEREGVLLAGVGINLAHAPDAGDLRREAAVPAGTLFDSCAREPPPPFVFWQSLVRAVIVEYTQTVARRGLSEILQDLVPLLAWRNSPITVADGGNIRITGRYEGIGPEGDLLLRLETGEIRSLRNGSLFRA
jgi:BirA family biotin operon repressor/biotin-[acetyl-CoA-carboxylase] ligase